MNRKQKILRNLLLSALLCLAIHAVMGFPPYTVGGMCRQVERDYLLEDVEPLYIRREKQKYSGEMFSRGYTYVIARSGEYYIPFLYERDILRNSRRESYDTEVTRGTLCAAWKGMLYVAGDFAGIERAQITVSASNGTDVREFSFAGERLHESLFGICYSEDELGWIRLEETPVEEMDLAQIARYWYRTPSGANGYSYDHAELPVRVDLYDGGGELVRTLEMTVGTYELHLWI